MSNKLFEERKNVSFPIEKMSSYIYGGEEGLKLAKNIYNVVSTDPVLKNDPSVYELDWLELQQRSTEITKRMKELREQGKFQFSHHIWGHFPMESQGSIGLSMGHSYIKLNGTDEQYQKWGAKIPTFEYMFAYAQTEMAHGSDVQNLQTTATYDSQTDEFIIHTPTIKDVKWWPGELGRNATHAVVFAQLIIDGKKYGTHAFVVQIRDLVTHKCLPGVDAGDIGPKLGYHGKDNGFLKFDNVRISREGLLCRYTKVHKGGKYERSGNEKFTYATMMEIRDMILQRSWCNMARAMTIGIRYSIIRTQFKASNGQERSIIDYQTQQDKLLTFLASAYAQNSGAALITEKLKENLRRVQQHNDFSMLKDCHGLLSGCKSVYTQEAVDSLTIARLACGGHGYTNSSGLNLTMVNLSADLTLEGDNTVMALQCARFLINCLKKLKKGKALSPETRYLANIQGLLDGSLKCGVKTIEDFNLEEVHKALIANSCQLLLTAAQQLEESTKKHNGQMKEAWDQDVGMDLVKAAKTFVHVYSFESFKKNLEKEQDSSVRKALINLCCLYGIEKLLQTYEGLYESGFMSKEQFKMMKQAKKMYFVKIRPDAVGLVDAFIIPDNTLLSAIGGYDGKAYETLWDWANKLRWNQGDTMRNFVVKTLRPKL